jgi:flagellar biosynthesis protein FlhA
VLVNGHEGPDAAGAVIHSFGNFLIGGDYAVGIFVFLILMIINLVVITKGAGRVSEVSPASRWMPCPASRWRSTRTSTPAC